MSPAIDLWAIDVSEIPQGMLELALRHKRTNRLSKERLEEFEEELAARKKMYGEKKIPKWWSRFDSTINGGTLLDLLDYIEVTQLMCERDGDKHNAKLGKQLLDQVHACYGEGEYF